MQTMKRSARSTQQGFVLIAALLLLFLLSALAVGLIYTVNSETKISSNDQSNTLAYYNAEAGMEKMMSDLGQLYQVKAAPTALDIQNLSNAPPNLGPDVGFTTYQYTVPVQADGVTPVTTVHNISSGPNAGLVAEIVGMTLTVGAQRINGAEVKMTRNVEVALIPVFQFGVFSDSDLSYFPGPMFDFAGRVHTNGNLYLAESNVNGLIFHSKISAVKDIIRQTLSNTVGVVATGRDQPVFIPTAPGGCDNGANPPGPACRNLVVTEGSLVGGLGSGKNGNWPKISTSTYNSLIVNGLTGAKPLTLPFTAAGVDPIQIIRKPPKGGDADPLLAASRLYNQAQIRVLLADNPADLSPAGAGDAQNVRLANVAPYAAGVPVVPGGVTWFAEVGVVAPVETDWKQGAGTPLIDGYLRVEFHKADGTFQAATQEWLQLGIGRGLIAQGAAYTAQLPSAMNPNAILVFQMPRDTDGNGAINGTEPTVFTGANTKNNWYPINLYDTREGENRDVAANKATSLCRIGGVMNIVELNVDNLRKWLLGQTGSGIGTQVESTTQNGYILYFSDRRGMSPNPNDGNQIDGEYGYEDNINAANAAGTPDGKNPPDPEEDRDNNGKLDVWGAANLGTGFGLVGAPASNPIQQIDCFHVGRKNRVTGARHAIMLMNGGLNKLPLPGFTVASENPVYVQGNYNAVDNTWPKGSNAAVIADAVTLLTNNWWNLQSLQYPIYYNCTPPGPNPLARCGATSYYRVAIATGKNKLFNQPGWGAPEDFGTDGGVHNFLRYLEGLGNATMWYKGSMVSLYYSQYAVGVFKCCNVVYSAPDRRYSFDVNFLDPNQLPPGTPKFRDVENVGFAQNFSTQ
jgi:Tfp pilus assembly protein PilX